MTRACELPSVLPGVMRRTRFSSDSRPARSNPFAASVDQSARSGIVERYPFTDHVPLPQRRLKLEGVGKGGRRMPELPRSLPQPHNLRRRWCLLPRRGDLKANILDRGLEFGTAGQATCLAEGKRRLEYDHCHSSSGDPRPATEPGGLARTIGAHHGRRRRRCDALRFPASTCGNTHHKDAATMARAFGRGFRGISPDRSRLMKRRFH